jgi:hypothetical protein
MALVGASRGNITGTNIGSYTAHLGLPRTVAASMEVAF